MRIGKEESHTILGLFNNSGGRVFSSISYTIFSIYSLSGFDFLCDTSGVEVERALRVFDPCLVVDFFLDLVFRFTFFYLW